MADEAAYGAVRGDSNKRKYDDSPPPVARRTTGFSSAPDSAAPPSSYNSIPPPPNEIEIAKQKVQEIAARLLNNSDPSKRTRVENGDGVGGGFESFDAGNGQKHSCLPFTGPPQGASYGYPGPSKKIEIPNGKVGVIIGKGGDTIKYLQADSGAKIQVTRDTDADPYSLTRVVELTGSPDEIAKAEQMINEVLSQAAAGSSSIGSRRMSGQATGGEQFSMTVPNNKVGLVIGKGGETIKSMQGTTGARIQVVPLHLPLGDMSKERTVQIEGTNEQIEAAKQLIEEVTSENRMRNQSMGGGGYNTLQGYQARPPTNWGPSGPPMQQYGYVQPGAYTGQPQYNMHQQPNYPGYPPTSSGYATSWEQSTAPQNQQVAQGGGSYDYYSQQQQQPTQQQQTQGGPTDGSGYNYNQAQAYSQGQGYSQDEYGYNYGQPQTNPTAGYDQQQQGYSNAAYGNVTKPAPDGQISAYETLADTKQTPTQPSPNATYPHQGSTQPGYGTQPSSGYGSYGAPQAVKPSGQPAAYAQPQQSTIAQGGGYAQYSQAPHVQPGYAQADAGAQRPPASQHGYGVPPYGAPPAAQPGYGQHPYGSGYGGGYSTQQAPAYPTDATTTQSAGPTAAAKASPPS